MNPIPCTNETNTLLDPAVTTTHHRFRWEDLTGPVASRSSRILLQHRKGCYYLNPQVTVFCVKPTERFLRKLRYDQDKWQTTIDSTLTIPKRRDFIRRAGPLGRELVYSGILIIDGLRVDPVCWSGIEINAVIRQLAHDMQSRTADVYHTRAWLHAHEKDMAVYPDGSLKWKNDLRVWVDPKRLPRGVERVQNGNDADGAYACDREAERITE
jgi:hypothetical protein